MTDTVSRRVRFDNYELDLDTAELWSAGLPVDLPPQPSRVLALLVDHAAVLVTRDVLRERIWGTAAVEWETGLHQAISRIRTTLGDSAAEPRFIETVPRRGYRFIGRLRSDEHQTPAAGALPPVDVRNTGRSTQIIYSGIAFVLAGVTALVLSIPTALQQHGDGTAPSDALAPFSTDPHDAEANRLYEEASHLVRQRDFEAAIERFERATARAPGWAEPWSARAETELARPAVGRVERARLALEGALARDADNARAWRQLAQLRLWEEWDWLGGQQALERAAALEPKSANLWQLRAAMEIVHGRFDKAVAAARRAVALDPISTGLRADLGWTLYYAGDIAGATSECRRSLELDPANPSAFQCLVQALLVEGRNDELVTLVAERAISPTSSRSGESMVEDYFRRHLAYLDAEPGCGTTAAAEALAKLSLGDTEGALDALADGAREGRGWALPFAIVDPLFSAHREDARFIEAERALGL
ncbi:MAG: winged helix-turn-helix domain-containing protein [Acidobacteriota bacterium]